MRGSRGGAKAHPRAVSGFTFLNANRLGKTAAAAVLALNLLGGAYSFAATGPESPPSGRLAPPAQVQCDRNQLTSYSGTVSTFDRQADTTHIEITTDWGSVEAFALPHPDGGPEQHFLLWGEPFKAEDWAQIEVEPGQLAEGLQAIVWVCEDESIMPVVDWRPGTPEGIGGRS